MVTRGNGRAARLLLGTLAALVLGAGTAQADIPAGSFTFDNAVTAIARGDDGSTYLGGYFTKQYTPTGGGAVFDATSDGTIDADSFPHIPGMVSAVVPDGAGGWYVGGSFQMEGDYVTGEPGIRDLAHVRSDGTLDSGWTPNPEDATVGAGRGGVRALARDGDTLYVAGAFTAIGGAQRENLAALNTATGQARPWNVAVDRSSVDSIGVADNTVYVGGGFAQIGGEPRAGLAALSASDGDVLDWNPESNEIFDSFRVWTFGHRVYVAGVFTQIAGEQRRNVASFDRSTLPRASSSLGIRLFQAA